MRNRTSFAAVLLSCVALAGCSSDGKSSSDGAIDVGAGGGGGTRPSLPANNLSCNQLRICTAECADQPCVDACMARSAASGRSQFETLAACIATEATCDAFTSGLACRCETACFADSACIGVSDECTGAEENWVCDELCH